MSTICEMMHINDINCINGIEDVVIGIYFVNGDKISIYQNTTTGKFSLFVNNEELDNFKDKFKLCAGPFRTVHLKTIENGKSKIFEPTAVDPLTGQPYVYEIYDDQTTINSNQDIQMNSNNSSANESMNTMNTEITKIDSIDSSSNNTQVLSYSKVLENNSNDKNKNVPKPTNNKNKNVPQPTNDKNKNIPEPTNYSEPDRNNWDKLKIFLDNHIHKKDDFFNDMIRVCDEKIKLIQDGTIDNIYINSFHVISDRLKNQEWIFLKFPRIINDWNQKLSKITNDEVKITIKKGPKYDAIYLHHSKIIIK